MLHDVKQTLKKTVAFEVPDRLIYWQVHVLGDQRLCRNTKLKTVQR